MVSHGREKRKGLAWVPRGFVFEQFGKQAERCALLVSDLYGRTFRRNVELDDWAPYSKSYLESLLTRRNYKVVVENCLDAGLVQFADKWNYAPGHHCKHYRLGSRYRHRDWELTELQIEPADWTLERLPNDAYRWAAESAQRVRLLNVPEAAVVEEAQRKAADAKLPQVELARLYAQRVAAARTGVTPPICDEYGRLHTAVTNLNGCFRSFLRLDGEPLAGWDIRTSQPLWLGLLVAEQNTAYPSMAGETGVNTETQQGIIRGDDDSGVLPVSSRWMRCVVSGDLYDVLRYESGLVRLTRDRVKQRVFSVLYGPNLSEDDPVLVAIYRLYPDVAEYIFRVKDVARLRYEYARLRRKQTDWDAWKLFRKTYRSVYGRLACLLQRREAEFIFGRVVPRLMEAGVPAVTIHDCVLTRQSEQSTVRKVMYEEFEKVGVAAQLHEVRYDGMGEAAGGAGPDPGVRVTSVTAGVRSAQHVVG